jgi:P27 family predicted phage terminase small subunit
MNAVEPFPEAPEALKEPGRAAWETGQALWLQGTLNNADLRAWETYCRAVDEVAHCDKIVSDEGEYHHTQNGAIIQHPAINRRRDAEKTMWRYEQAFGLVPEKRNKRPASGNTKGVAQRPK